MNLKVVAINGSPRKNWNTDLLCQEALKGAASVGAQTELIQLESLKFKGCMSCYACHAKRTYNETLCFYKDELTDVLKKCLGADAIIIGSPIYYGFVSGDCRALMERLMFPLDTYVLDENGNRPVKTAKVIPTALLYTMNANEQQMSKGKDLLSINERELRRIFGYCETYYAYDTCQFKDYDVYAANLFNAEHKYEQLKNQFPIDKKKAYELGKRLVIKIGECNV